MISRIKMTLLTGAAALAAAALGTGMAAEHSAAPPTPTPSAFSSTASGSPGMSQGMSPLARARERLHARHARRHDGLGDPEPDRAW